MLKSLRHLCATVWNQGRRNEPGSRRRRALRKHWCVEEVEGRILLTAGLTREVFLNINGDTIPYLVSAPSFPNNPSSVGTISTFETPSNIGDNLGQRVHGYVTPTQTGDYTFWIASDGNSQLWLNPNGTDPSRAQLIASESDRVGPQGWEAGSERSASIHLVAGQSYYILALQKEGSGNDNLAVAWQKDGNDTPQVIPGTYLTTFTGDSSVVPSQPTNLLVNQFIYTLANAPTPQMHATTVLDLGGGNLLASWFAGTAERNIDTGIWVSRYDGIQWSTPVQVATGAEHESQDYACWNPVLFQPAGGPITLFYKVGPSPTTWWGRSMTSSDGGVTWSDSIKLPSPILGPIKNQPVQLANGTIINPTSDESNGWRVYFELSHDNGQTWQRVGPVVDNGIEAIQPAILVHPDGRLQALCRSRSGVIAETWSTDNGQTWSPLALTTLPNPSSGIDAITLSNGQFMLAYNPTVNGRSPLVIAISDDGLDWHDVMVLENSPGEEFSYPSLIQADDGRVHITYTWNRQAPHHAVLELNPHNPSAAGVFRNGYWYLDVNHNGKWDGISGGDAYFGFGTATDKPLTGDWNGDGQTDVGVFRNGKFLLDANGNRKWDDVAGGDQIFTFGNPTDLPIVGDWNGDGKSDIGVFRSGLFYLDLNGNGVWNGNAGGDYVFAFGNPTDKPLTGDWNGDGKTDIGVVRNGAFYLDVNGNRHWDQVAFGDAYFKFGNSTDIPITGDWNGDGRTDVGVARGRTFYLDKNGNHKWDGAPVRDLTFGFGNATDIAITGHWTTTSSGASLSSTEPRAASAESLVVHQKHERRTARLRKSRRS